MPNPWEKYSAPQNGPLVVQTKGADPKQPGQIQGQQLSNQKDAATVPYAGPQAQADLAKTQGQVENRPYQNADDLAKRFETQDAVKQYRAIVPIFLAGLKAKDDAGGDNALLYAYAKVMDPGSVVRESETENAQNATGFWDAKVAKLRKDFGEPDGGLSGNVRTRLRREMNTKAAELAKSYGVQRSDYQKMAQARGVDPFQVVGSPPASAQQIKDYTDIMHGKGFTLRDEIMASANPPSTTGPVEGRRVVDPTGGNEFSTDRDKQYAAVAQAAFNNGADRQQMDAIAQAYGAPAFGEDLDKAIATRRAGGRAQFSIPASGHRDANIVGQAIATPVGTAAANYLNAASFGVPQLLAGDAPFEALQRENPKSALTGDILGSITGTLGAGAGLVKAGVSVPRAGLAANLAYGPIYGANTHEDNRAIGAGAGLAGSLVGEGVGRYAISPVVDAAIRSKLGQAATGMFGGSIPRRMSNPESSLASDLTPEAGDIRSVLDEAQRFNLPMSLADASPTARQTLGAATRLDPTVRTNIGTQLENRAADRNSRALSGLSQLAEPVDMRATSEGIFKAAQDTASPFYERAYAQPAIVTPELSNLLKRPSLQEAMGKARGTIAEQGGNPMTMGFALDASGNPVLNPIPTNHLAELGAAQTALEQAQNALAKGNASLAGNVDRRGLQANVDAAQQRHEQARARLLDAPSVGTLAETPAYNWKALDYTKRGLDDVLEGKRDPITRRLPNDRGIQAIQSTRADYRNALGNLNDDYRQGLDAYSGIARRNDDLNAGFSAADPSTNLPDFRRSLSNVPDEGLDYFRRGYVTNLSDKIRAGSDSTNAYDVIAKGMDRKDKLASIFPNAPDFLRQRELERMMAQTNQEVLGGPATAGRLEANDRFRGPDLSGLADAGISMVAGGPSPAVIANGARAAARGMFGRRSQEMTADAARNLAPKLADTAPTAAKDSLQSLLDDYNAITRYNNALRTGSAVIAAPALTATGSYYF